MAHSEVTKQDEAYLTAQWHRYELGERHASWKLLLPVSENHRILALGLRGKELSSLARSYKIVHVHACSEVDIAWAMRQGETLGQEYRFETVPESSIRTAGFEAVAVGSRAGHTFEPNRILRLMKPGAGVVWIGVRGALPKPPYLRACGYGDIKRYLFLPSRNPKVMLPLSHASITRTALNFYIPNKSCSRIAHRILLALQFAGLTNELSRNQAVFARNMDSPASDAFLLTWLANRLQKEIADVAIYTGWTKLVLQLIGPGGSVLGIAKLADVSEGQRGILKENEALRRIHRVEKLRKYVPRLLLEARWNSRDIQVQTALKLSHRSFSRELTVGHIEFLKLLPSVDFTNMTLHEWPLWSHLERFVSTTEFRSESESQMILANLSSCERDLKNRKIPFYRNHGDFTPWHVILEGREIRGVFDWERSSSIAPPFYDVAYFVLARDMFLRGERFPLEKALSQP